MISGHGTIETAVRATKLGAYDFAEKPLSLEKTLILVKNAAEARRLRHENLDLRKQLQSKSVIAGDSVPMKALRQQIALMAPTNGRVLIYGPKACARIKPSSRSTARRFLKTSSTANSSATANPRSRARPPTRKVNFKRPIKARYFWMKSAT
jgi:hypothetical protein